MVSGERLRPSLLKRVGIVAALPGELKPLVRGWLPLNLPRELQGNSAWHGQIGSASCVAVAAGIGSDAAARACTIAQREGALDALLSVGWAGALSCGVHPGRAYAVAQVVNAASGERFESNLVPESGTPLRLVTLDHIALAKEKRTLAQTYQAVLVDMEAATVAGAAKAQGIEFYCFKAVSDAQGEVLPDFSRFTDSQGKLALGRLMTNLAMRPVYWPGMMRLSKNTRMGAQAIAVALREFFER
jgi:adenosylhomocysteine nucleosidase